MVIVTKHEVYTAVVLITIILISVLWREELKYRRSYVEVKTLTAPHYIQDTTSSSYLGKRKTNPKYWLKKYGDGMLFRTVQ